MSTPVDLVRERLAPRGQWTSCTSASNGTSTFRDLVAVDVTAACYVAHRGGGDPLWMLLVSPPSSGKTEPAVARGLPRGVPVVLAHGPDVRLGLQGTLLQPPQSARRQRALVLDVEGLHHRALAPQGRTLRDPGGAPGDLRRRVHQGLRQRPVRVLVGPARVPGRSDARDRPTPPGPRRPRPAVPDAPPAPGGPRLDHQAGPGHKGPRARDARRASRGDEKLRSWRRSGLGRIVGGGDR